MKPTFNKKVTLIGGAFDKGAGTRGAALGPIAMRYAGLEKRLEAIGYQVKDLGDFTSKKPESLGRIEGLKNLDAVKDISQQLMVAVEETLEEGSFPLILGGDHSIAIGTIKGVLGKYQNPGLIWFDAHGDINTHETSDSGNIHGMPTSALLGIGHPALNEIGGTQRKLNPPNMVFVAGRDLDRGERRLFKELGITVFTMYDIDRMGIARVTEKALEIAGKDTDAIHLSFDVDGVDPQYIPGTGTRVPGGVSYREANFFLEIIAQDKKVVSGEFVEVNPLLDDQNKTAEMTVTFIGSFMGEWIL